MTPEKLAQVKEENKKKLDIIEDLVDANMLFFFGDCVE